MAVEKLLKLGEHPLAGGQTVVVDRNGPDQFQVVVIGRIVLGRAGARITSCPQQLAEDLRKP